MYFVHVTCINPYLKCNQWFFNFLLSFKTINIEITKQNPSHLSVKLYYQSKFPSPFESLFIQRLNVMTTF